MHSNQQFGYPLVSYWTKIYGATGENIDEDSAVEMLVSSSKASNQICEVLYFVSLSSGSCSTTISAADASDFLPIGSERCFHPRYLFLEKIRALLYALRNRLVHGRSEQTIVMHRIHLYHRKDGSFRNLQPGNIQVYRTVDQAFGRDMIKIHRFNGTSSNHEWRERVKERRMFNTVSCRVLKPKELAALNYTEKRLKENIADSAQVCKFVFACTHNCCVFVDFFPGSSQGIPFRSKELRCSELRANGRTSQDA